MGSAFDGNRNDFINIRGTVTLDSNSSDIYHFASSPSHPEKRSVSNEVLRHCPRPCCRARTPGRCSLPMDLPDREWHGKLLRQKSAFYIFEN